MLACPLTIGREGHRTYLVVRARVWRAPPVAMRSAVQVETVDKFNQPKNIIAHNAISFDVSIHDAHADPKRLN